MKVPAPLVYLWAAITIPVVGTGALLYTHLKAPEPVVYTHTVVITPTASPSATLEPTKPVLHKVSLPVEKGGVK